MRQEAWLADRLDVTVSGIFTTRHLMRTATSTLGGVTLLPLRMEGLFRGADGRELIVKQINWWRGTYELRDSQTTLGTANPLDIFRRENDLGFLGQPYRLRTTGFGGRVCYLEDETGEIVVEVHPRGTFRCGATLRILKAVDVGLLVLAYRLVNARWQEQTGAATAGAAASR